MTDSSTQTRHVAVIGAGPAGLFAARTLAEAGVHVSLFNRDVKPGGLAEYGIYHSKETMKNGLRKQFRRIMDEPLIAYYGNITIGEDGDLTLSELKSYGFDAILVTVGAQGTKWLGLPGEELEGVYHAKDLVYHYNKLPPYAAREFPIGKRVALIGAGNVMLDIAHWTIRDLKVDEVTAIVRRGPAEIKFTPKEFEIVATWPWRPSKKRSNAAGRSWKPLGRTRMRPERLFSSRLPRRITRCRKRASISTFWHPRCA